MLSWNDDGDVFTKRAPLGKAGSLSRPGNSFELPRAISSRTSSDVPVPPGGRKFGESAMSPASSLTKANSLLRGPGSASAGGTIGSEGWWRHTDNGQMNEATAADQDNINGWARAEAFVAQANVTGPQQPLWADDMPAAAATPTPPAAGGSHYGSLFPGDVAAAAPPQQLGGGFSAEVAAAGDDIWSSFESAPKA